MTTRTRIALVAGGAAVLAVALAVPVLSGATAGTSPCSVSTETCQDARLSALEAAVGISPSPSPTVTASPSPTVTISPSVTATVTPSPTPTITPTPTPTPTVVAARWPGDDGKGLYYGASLAGGDPLPFEATLGKKLQTFRSYFVATSSLTSMTNRASADVTAGRLPWISTKLPASWAVMASGAQDPWLKARNAALGALPGPVWFTLHHEPTGDGPAADWVAMQQHERTLLDACSTCENVALVGILNGYPFTSGDPAALAYRHPVGTGVHIMAFDSYNPWYAGGAKQWRSAAYVLSPALTIQSWGYPTAVGEYGVRNDPANPGKAAAWMSDAYVFATAHGLAGMSYFDSGINSPDGPWTLDGERLTAFRTALTTNTPRH